MGGIGKNGVRVIRIFGPRKRGPRKVGELKKKEKTKMHDPAGVEEVLKGEGKV